MEKWEYLERDLKNEDATAKTLIVLGLAIGCPLIIIIMIMMIMTMILGI